jgi:Tfp pilus assembly protein PilX
MINTSRNFRKEIGAVTFIITTILIVLITLIILFAASYNMMQQKLTANQFRAAQAFTAAEAGLEFGIVYFQQNSATILTSPSNGHLAAFSNASTTNVSLANGSKYSIVFSNPIANNYTLIKVTSTGTSSDNTATRTISQNILFGSLLIQAPNLPLISKGSISLAGNGTVTNTFNNTTIQSALGVSISGSAQTNLASGKSSTAGNIKSDIQQNVTSLQNTTQTDLFATYFGTATSNIQNNVNQYYSNSGNTNYSNLLNGMTGKSIWINQIGGTATINGNTTIGSSANPVLLIVNGNLSMSGNATIYGLIFIIGTSGIDTLTGNININGALITSDNLSMSGSSNLNFDPTVLNNLRTQPGISYYAKVPGTWKDF